MKPFPQDHTLADSMTAVINHGKRCEICELWATEGRDLRDLRCLDGTILIQEMFRIKSRTVK
jgi:hypothetical protein